MFFRFQGPLLKYRKLFWSTIVQTIKARISTKLTVDRVPCSPSLYVYFLYEIHQMSILAKCLLLPNVPFVKCPRPLFSFSPRYLFFLSLSLSLSPSLSLSLYLSIYLSIYLSLSLSFSLFYNCTSSKTCWAFWLSWCPVGLAGCCRLTGWLAQPTTKLLIKNKCSEKWLAWWANCYNGLIPDGQGNL